MEKLQLILSHFHCCLTVDAGCSLIEYDDLVMIILEYEGCYIQMYDLDKTTIRLKKLLEDTNISWQRRNIIGTIERLERKQASFFGFYTPPETPPEYSSEEVTQNGNSTYAFFPKDMKKTQNSVLEIRKQDSFFGFYTPPGTPPNSSSEEITANGNSTYAFFPTDMKKTQNRVHDIYSPGTPSSQSSFSSDDVTPNGN